MSHRLPLAIGVVALLSTLSGCAQAPRAAVAARHPVVIVDFAISNVTPRAEEMRSVAEMRPMRFDWTPRSETMVRQARPIVGDEPRVGHR